jgi:Mrp family chromosome partitioning ATPase
MSVTDQAFIRAYDSDAKSPAVAALPLRRSLSGAASLNPSANAIGSGHPAFGGVTTATSAPSLTNGPASARMAGTYPASAAAIHVGMGSIIPPPHAKFGASAMYSQSSITSTLAGGPQIISAPGDMIISSDRSAAAHQKLPHADFGQSRKATLSSFTQRSQPESFAEKLARPALEVDAVRWPAVCENILSRQAAAFDQLANQLRHEAEIGCRVVAITGVERSEGRSTLALCVARRLAAGNSTVALVDADFAKPGLSQQLTVRVDRGWETVLWGERELWDIAIESVTDRMALVPLGSDSNSDLPAPLGRLANCFDTLAQHYDLVLVDAGPLTGDSVAPQWLLDRACGVQGIILAHDVRRRAANRVAAVCLQLAESNQRQLGIAEIFVDEQAAGGKRLAAVPV